MGVLNLLAQTSTDGFVTTTTYTTTDVNGGAVAAFSGVYLLFWLIITVLLVAAWWKMFSKAGEAGWQAIIPIWSTIVLLKIIGKPWWWILGLFIPILNIVIMIIVCLELGKSFNKDAVWSIFLLFFLSIIGFLMLGFGSAKYVGPGGNKA